LADHINISAAGKIKEAEAIEQSMRAKGGSVPPAGYAPQVSAAHLHTSYSYFLNIALF
jgi:hypothetical protein